MKKTLTKLFVICMVFCMSFMSISLFTDGLYVHAATSKIKVTGTANQSNHSVYLKWNKISKPYNGYAIVRDGHIIKYGSKKTVSYTVTGVPAGYHTYQIKSYKKTKQYYNSKKKKWVTKKPKSSQWKGKKTRYVYSYKTSSNTVTLLARKYDQSISGTSSLTGYVGDRVNFSASATSGLGLSYTQPSSGIASVYNGYIICNSAGTDTFRISQGGNSTYNATSKTVSIKVSKHSQTIYANNKSVVEGNTISLGASTSSSLGLTYSSNNTAVATVNSNGIVTGKKPGTAAITITQAGNYKYLPAAKNITVTVTEAPIVKQDQIISASSIEINVDETAKINANSNSGLTTFTYASSNTNIATVDANGNVTGKAKGTTTIAIMQAGNKYYNPAMKVISVVVKDFEKLNQDIDVVDEVVLQAQESVNLNPTATSNLTTFQYQSMNTEIATVDNNGKITAKQPGITSVIVTQPGNDEYNKATKAVIVTVEDPVSTGVEKLEQDIEASDIVLNINTSETINASASSSLTNFTYISTDTGIATVTSSGVVTGVAEGTTSIVITQPGNDEYNPKSISISVTVNAEPIVKKAQTIKLGVDQSVYRAIDPGIDLNLLAKAYDKETNEETGLPLTYSSDDASIVSVASNGVITSYKAGTAKITIKQAGNDYYKPITKTITITVNNLNKDPQIITAQNMTINKGDSLLINASVNSNLPLRFSSADTSVASIDSNGYITGVAEGSTIVTISQAGNNDYLPASKTINVTVIDDNSQNISEEYNPKVGTYVIDMDENGWITINGQSCRSCFDDPRNGPVSRTYSFFDTIASGSTLIIGCEELPLGSQLMINDGVHGRDTISSATSSNSIVNYNNLTYKLYMLAPGNDTLTINFDKYDSVTYNIVSEYTDAGAEEYFAALDEIIANNTNDSMTAKQKMEAVGRVVGYYGSYGGHYTSGYSLWVHKTGTCRAYADMLCTCAKRMGIRAEVVAKVNNTEHRDVLFWDDDGSMWVVYCTCGYRMFEYDPNYSLRL